MIDLPYIQWRMNVELEESGSDILLTWQEYGSVTVDPVTESRLGTPTERQEVVQGFVHYVQVAAQSQVRQFAEVEVGDCILDLPPDVVIEGREGLTFTVAGVVWSPKSVSGKLAQSWDGLARGDRLFRTILLRK